MSETKTNCIRWLDSSTLALAQSDGSLILADAHRFSATTEADFHADSILGIEVCSQNHNLLLSWGLDRTVKIFDLREDLRRHVIQRLWLEHGRPLFTQDDFFTGAKFLNCERSFVTAEAHSQ